MTKYCVQIIQKLCALVSLTFRQYNYSKTISVKIPSLFVGLPSGLSWTRTTSLSLSFLQHNGRRSLPCASARARVALNMRRGVRSDLFFGNQENGISGGKTVQKGRAFPTEMPFSWLPNERSGCDPSNGKWCCIY